MLPNEIINSLLNSVFFYIFVGIVFLIVVLLIVRFTKKKKLNAYGVKVSVKSQPM